MKLQDAIVLITGANRGIGLAFAEAALVRGARKVYAETADVPARIWLARCYLQRDRAGGSDQPLPGHFLVSNL